MGFFLFPIEDRSIQIFSRIHIFINYEFNIRSKFDYFRKKVHVIGMSLWMNIGGESIIMFN